MSRRERDTQVPLDELMSEGQIEIVRSAVIGALVGRAGDLHLLNQNPDPKAELKRVASLGRLASWFYTDTAWLPDSGAVAAVLGLARSIDDMNEWDEVVERYEKAMAEHDAIHALVAVVSGAPESGCDRCAGRPPSRKENR